MAAVLDMLAQGGPIIWLLGVLSLLSLALIGAKAMQLRGVLSGPEARHKACDLWEKGDLHGAEQAISGGAAPADRIMRSAMDGLREGRSRDALDKALEWRGNAELAEMHRHIRLLELIAMVSPLLGLLGTVLGMIQAFQELALAEGAANASLLAGGIWQALLTTAAGLVVAIPSAVAASLLNGRAERAGQEMEAAVGQLYLAEDSRS